MVRHSRRSYRGTPLLSGSGHTRKQSNSLDAVTHMQMIVSRSVYMVRYPRSSYIVSPLLSGSGHPRSQINSLDAVIHLQESPPQRRFLVRMQLTLHATRPTPHGGALRLVQAMSAWSVKTQRAPFRRCMDARVYGHTTTAIHDKNNPPPPAFTKADRYRRGQHDSWGGTTASNTSLAERAVARSRKYAFYQSIVARHTKEYRQV